MPGYRPVSSYMYGGGYGAYHVAPDNTPGSVAAAAPNLTHPVPPPAYDPRDREMAARIRRYHPQQQ